MDDLLGMKLWEEICEWTAKTEDLRMLNDMIAKEKIMEPVLITSRHTRHIIESVLPNMFCILSTDLLTDDKVYMVCDKAIADSIRKNLMFRRERTVKE